MLIVWANTISQICKKIYPKFPMKMKFWEEGGDGGLGGLPEAPETLLNVLVISGEISKCSTSIPIWSYGNLTPGPSCSKLMTSLVNDSLNFSIKWYTNMLKFFAEKLWVAFAVQKLLTFFEQKISEYCVLNLPKQLTKRPLISSLS